MPSVHLTCRATAAATTAIDTMKCSETAAGLRLVSTTIPYSLEHAALKRLPARAFGVLVSLEPAVAALVGLIMLGETLAVTEWAAIACVMIACAGAARGSVRSQAPEA